MSNDTPAVWSPRPVSEVFTALRPADRAPGEAARFAAEMPTVLARFEETDPTRARTELGHLTTLMRSSEETAAKLAERGFFRRMWGRLTGDEPANAAEVRARLGEVQARALAVTERLLTREAFLAHAAHHLGGRLELLAVENVKLKGALVALGERVVERVERLESRLARLERRSDGLERRIALTELFQSGYSPSLHAPYYEIEDPLERALTLARDFAEAAGGDWRPIDLHRLQTLAQVDAQLADMDPLLMHEWVDRALALADRRSVVDWLRHGALGVRLMAPLDEETREARSFYPIHFLLQRPAWFVEQGLPRTAATGVIADELRAYGLDMSEALTPWRLVQLLLEERMAWSLEAPLQAAALPGPTAPEAGPALVGRTLPTGGRLPDILFMVGGEPIMRALDESHGKPVLLEWVGGVARPITPQPPLAELPVARHRYSVSDGVLYIVAAEGHRVAAGRRGSAPGEPWDWQAWPAGTPGSPVGVAAGPGRMLVWDRTVVIERIGDDRRTVPRPLIDAAVGADAGYLLLRDHVQRWPRGGEPLEWAAFPRGLKGVALAVSPVSMARPIALCRDPERQAVLVAAGLKSSTLPVADDAGFAPMGAGSVAVVSAGVVGIWNPSSAEGLVALSGAPNGMAGPIAADAEGRIVVFHPPSGAVRLFRPE